MVVSIIEKVQIMYQVWIRKTNTSESSLTCRKYRTESKLGSFVAPRQVCRQPVYWVGSSRHRDGVNLILAFMWNSGNLLFRCKGRTSLRLRVPMRSTGAEQLVVAMQHCNGCWAKQLRYLVEIV